MSDEDFESFLWQFEAAQTAFIRQHDQMPTSDWVEYATAIVAWREENSRLNREVQRVHSKIMEAFRAAKTAHRKGDWGQDNPAMQLMAIFSCIHGWAHNLETGVSTPLKAGNAISDAVDRAREVVEMLPDLDWDSPPFTPEKQI